MTAPRAGTTVRPVLARGARLSRRPAGPIPMSRARLPVVALWAAAGVAVTALVLALLLAGGGPQPAVAGLPDAGPVTGWGLPLLRLASDAAAVGTIGLLLTGSVLVATPTDELERIALRTVHAASSWSSAWCLCALGVLVLTVSETVGVPVTDLPPPVLVEQAMTGRGLALLAVAAISAAVAIGGRRTRTSRAARLALAGSLVGLVPTTVTSHAASAADHDLATTALMVHVIAATVWVGGLLAVLLVGHRHPQVLMQTVPRFSAAALAAFTAVGLSGTIGALGRLDMSLDAWTSGYGAVLVAKVVVLGLLGAAGWRHRRRLLPALQEGRSRAFLVFAAGELAVMGAALGLAVALSRTPARPAAETAVRPDHGAGHETLATSIPPFEWTRLVLEWRPDALVLTLAGLSLAAYAAGVRSLRSAGRSWSWWRAGAFTGGVAVTVLALCGGLAVYAPAMVSAQVCQFLLMLVGAPALLVLGAPLTLWLRVRRLAPGTAAAAPVPPMLGGRAAHALADPATGLALVTVLVLVVYRTSLIEASLRGFWLHLLVNGLALVAGSVLLWPVLGADPVPHARRRVERLVPLVGVAGSLALLAAQLRYSDELLAGRWFLELGWWWVDPVADQRTAGALVAAAVVLLVPLLGLALTTASRPVQAEPEM